MLELKTKTKSKPKLKLKLHSRSVTTTRSDASRCLCCCCSSWCRPMSHSFISSNGSNSSNRAGKSVNCRLVNCQQCFWFYFPVCTSPSPPSAPTSCFPPSILMAYYEYVGLNRPFGYRNCCRFGQFQLLLSGGKLSANWAQCRMTFELNFEQLDKLS